MKLVIRNKIRRLRFDHGEMTQQELANAVGCTRQTINAIEACKYLPSLEIAFKVSLVFALPLNEVFYVEQPLPGDPPRQRSPGLHDGER